MQSFLIQLCNKHATNHTANGYITTIMTHIGHTEAHVDDLFGRECDNVAIMQPATRWERLTRAMWISYMRQASLNTNTIHRLIRCLNFVFRHQGRKTITSKMVITTIKKAADKNVVEGVTEFPDDVITEQELLESLERLPVKSCMRHFATQDAVRAQWMPAWVTSLVHRMRTATKPYADRTIETTTFAMYNLFKHAPVETQSDLLSLTPEILINVILKYAKIMRPTPVPPRDRRRMQTDRPHLRCQVESLYKSINVVMQVGLFPTLRYSEHRLDIDHVRNAVLADGEGGCVRYKRKLSIRDDIDPTDVDLALLEAPRLSQETRFHVSWDQMKLLLSVAPSLKLRCYILLLGGCGLRRGAVAAMRLTGIMEFDGVPTSDSKFGTPVRVRESCCAIEKYGEKRDFKLCDGARDCIWQYYTTERQVRSRPRPPTLTFAPSEQSPRPFNPYLFPHAIRPLQHVPEDCVSASIHKLCVSNAVHAAHAHAFRKGFITHVIKSGCSVKEASKLVGHRSVTLTDQVYNCNDSDILDVLKKVPTLLGNNGHLMTQITQLVPTPIDLTTIPQSLTAEHYAHMLTVIRSLQERCNLAETILHRRGDDDEYTRASTALPNRTALLYTHFHSK